MARKPKRARPTRSSKTPFNQNDLPVVIRISDTDQALIPHIEVSRAIGFIKAKARQLTAILWRNSRRRNTLPDRTYYYAMPVGVISMIELKTNPREQSWHARIIGGGVRFGSFIWIPTDDVNGDKPQILVKSLAFEGPYEVFVDYEPDLFAGNFDWKGPTRSTDVNGAPLVDPTQITDVVTIQGPENRVHQIAGPVSLSTSSWKDGSPYATAPNGDDVLGAAIQGTFGSGTPPDTGRKDVMICREESTFTLTGGPNGIGTLAFTVYVRPEAALIDGSLTDPTPWHPDDNPNGWKKIATLPAFDGIYSERWRRTAMWYFNRDGTQASCFLPETLDAARVRRCFTGCPEDSGSEPENFPMHIRLATIDIDAFAETASISFEAREPIFEQTRTGSVTGSASGSWMNFCFGAPVGSFTTSRSETLTISYSGEPRRVAVDYKGNTRVFARLGLISGAGTSITYATNETHVGNNPAFGLLPPHPFACPGNSGCPNATIITVNGTQSGGSKFGYDLQVGSSVVPIWHTEETISHSVSASGDCGVPVNSGSATEQEIEDAFNVQGIAWLDLREDLVVVTTGSHLIQGRKGTNAVESSSDDNLLRMVFDTPADPVSTVKATITVTRNGDTIAEYDEGTARRNQGIGARIYPRTRVQGTTTPTMTGCKIGIINCTINWSNTSFDVLAGDLSFTKAFSSAGPGVPVTTELNPISLESLTDRDDNLGAFPGNTFDFNGPGTIQTDTAGNVACSFKTLEGVTVTGFGGDADFTYPGPKYVNFIHGDDLIDVMNQVEYFDPGPDMEIGVPPGSGDDILLPPVVADSGRAKAIEVGGGRFLGTIKIL